MKRHNQSLGKEPFNHQVTLLRIYMKFFALLIIVVVLVLVFHLLIQNLTEPTHLGHKEGRLAAMPDKPNAGIKSN